MALQATGLLVLALGNLWWWGEGIERAEIAAGITVTSINFVISMSLGAGLWFGRTAAWYILVLLWGVGVAVATFFPFAVDELGGHPVAPVVVCLFLFPTVIYAGITWRTARRRTWWLATGGYGALIALLSAMALIAVGSAAVGVIVRWVIIAALGAAIHSIPTRWWCRVRLGWSGKYIEEAATAYPG